MAGPRAGGAAVVNPSDFAGYVFTVVLAIGGTAIAVAVARRITTTGHRRQTLGAGDTDPGRDAALRQLGSELDALRDEVAGLRRELDDNQNRLDFTERLLAQAKERGLLSAPKERGPS